MNRFTFFLWVLFLPVLVNAQEDFAPVGAEWYYSIGYGCCSGAGYQHFAVEKDTIYLGKSCKKVNVTRYDPSGEINNQYIFYTYNQNDSVLYSYDDNFYLLYDFNLNVGDTLKVRIPSDYYGIAFEYDDTIVTQTVSYIENTTINDLTLKRIYFDHPSYDFLVPYYEYYTEKLGGSDYFFPFEWEYTVEAIWPDFRCYSDSALQYKLVSKCDELRPPEFINNYRSVINKIWVSEKSLNISINAPDIVSNSLKITLIDVSGRIVYVTDMEYPFDIFSIDVSGMAKGIYFIRIDNNNLNITSKIVIL